MKRLISIILTLLLIISTAPISALAEEITENQQDVSGFFESPDGVEYDLSWSYTAETDTLYLDSEFVVPAVMEDSSEMLPLFYTDEGGNAVLWEGRARNVVFSNRVKGIGWNVLEYNVPDDMITITFEEGSQLEMIDDYAFYCLNVKEIILPDTVNYIGWYAFGQGEFGLIRMPHNENEIEISNYAFSYAKINSFDFNGCNIDCIPTGMFYYSTLNNFAIPEGIKTIGNYAFHCTTFPESYVLQLPSSIEKLCTGCLRTAVIKGIDFPEYNESRPITLEGSVFEAVKADIIDFNNSNVATIPSDTFRSSELYAIRFSNKTTTISSYAFADAIIETDIELPQGVETINNSTFSGATVKVVLPQNLKTIENNAFKNADIENTLVLPDSLEIIGTSSFNGAAVKRIVFPKGIKRIGASAFYNCQVEEESVFTYHTDETSIGTRVFTNSNITVWAISSDLSVFSGIDCEQHDVSGFFDYDTEGDDTEYDITWSYNAASDTLYVDGNTVKSFTTTLTTADGTPANEVYSLPLFYTNESGEKILWHGTYSNIIFGKNVKRLAINCIGKEGPYGNMLSVGFEENSTLEEIDNNAFALAEIESIEIPDSVYRIGEMAFAESTVKSIKLPNYRGSKTPVIEKEAFSETNINSIDFGSFGAESISSYAFQNASIETLNLPKTGSRIRSNAFYGCTVKNAFVVPENIESIGSSAFGQAKLNKIAFSKGLKTIENSAFSECRFTNGLVFSDEIGNLVIEQNAFRSSDLTSFEFTPSIASIGSQAFYSCKNLKTVTAQENCIIQTLSTSMFGSCTALESVCIPSSVKTTAGNIFTGCTSLSSVEFQKDSQLEYIGMHAFERVSSLCKVEIPRSVKTIDNYAFSNCTSLTEITFEEGSQLEEIGDVAFEACAAEYISLPEGVKRIDDYAFSKCENLTSFYLPSTLETLGEGVFRNDVSLAHINIPSGITQLPAETFANDVKLNITLPSSLTDIGESAFLNCALINNVPSSIKSFGDSSFSGTNIKTLNLSNRNYSLDIGEGAFKDCKNLESVTFENSRTCEFKGHIFEGCKKLSGIALPRDIDAIPDYFAYDSGLSGELILPDSVTKIGEYAFSKTKITSLYIPENVTNINDYAFASTEKLSSVIIEDSDNVLKMGEFVFYEASSLKSIVIPERMNYIYNYCFYNSGLTSVELPDSLERIGIAAFYRTDISSIAIGKKVVSIGNYAFQSCFKLKAVAFSEDSALKTIGNYAFEGCSKLSGFDIPRSVSNIKEHAFYGCNISQIVIPANVTEIGEEAFANTPMHFALVLGRNTIFDNRCMFYTGTNTVYRDGVLYGYSGSTAEAYANECNINFSSISNYANPEEHFDELYGSNSQTFGSCENGNWYYVNSNGTNRLFVEGDGAVTSQEITDQKGNEKTFAQVVKQFGITQVFVGEGITAIPDNFLYDSEGLNIKYVCLPNSLEKIGAHAFANTSLYRIYSTTRSSGNSGLDSFIPSNVNYIGAYAFANTKNLTHEFNLPKELTEVSEGLFYGSNVVHVEMYGKVKKIGSRAFSECANMTSLYVPCSVTEIYSAGNPAYNAFGFAGSELSENLWVLGRKNSAAYDYCNQKGIHFSECLGIPYRNGYFLDTNTSKENGKLIWEYYVEDDSIVLSSPVNKSYVIETDAKRFYEFDTDTGKTSFIKYINSAEDIDIKPEKVVLSRITEFTAPDLLSCYNPRVMENYNILRKIGERTYANCTRIEELEFPMSMGYAGAYAFENCTSLKRVRLGYGISTVSEGLFSECRKLESVDLGNVVLQNIGERAFYNCNALRFVNLSNETSYSNGTIGAQAFYNCVNLQEIFIPKNIKNIEKQAFYNCVQVQKITLSGNVQRIEKDAFANLFYCESITIDSEVNRSAFSNEKDIFANLGAYTNGIELNIGNNVENVDFKFFENLNVTSLNIGKGSKTLTNKQALSSLKRISACEGSAFSVKNGLLYSGNTLVLTPQALTQISVDPSTTAIDAHAFYGTNAKSITLPDSVEALGEGCFENSKTLVGITLSEGLTSISENAFKNCTKLRLLNLPENTVLIKESAFENCESLISAVFNNSLYSIGSNAFKGCSKLEGLAFPENLGSIQQGAFMNCTGLKYAYIWNATLGNNAFANDEKLNIFTPVGTDAYRYAREFNIPYSAYTDEALFFDEWAVKIDALAGYLGYCEEDGHGNIQYLTVYEADCENDGFVIGVCEYCSEILEEIHINAYGHSYKVESSVPATATTRGITVSTCEHCNRSITEYTAPLDESFEIQTHTVCGTVELSSNKTAAQGIAPAKNASIVIDDMVVATTDSDGRFSFELETGAYQAQIKYAYGFTRNVYFIVKNKDIEFAEPIIIIGCDFSKDGIINDEDIRLFQMIISAKKDDPSYLSFVDLNADGYINAKDLLYIKALNGLDEQTFKYPLLIIS